MIPPRPGDLPHMSGRGGARPQAVIASAVASGAVRLGKEFVVSGVQSLLDGLSFGESLRWHQDRMWLADWGAQEVVAVDREGRPEVMARVDFPAFPMCMDWLPDGRLLVVAARDGRLLRQAFAMRPDMESISTPMKRASGGA